jgi:hypothetical protein
MSCLQVVRREKAKTNYTYETTGWDYKKWNHRQKIFLSAKSIAEEKKIFFGSARCQQH